MRFLVTLILLGTLAMGGMAHAQSTTSTSSPSSSQQASPAPTTGQVSQNQTTLQAYQQEQQALAQSLRVLLAQNPTPQQLQVWQQQHAADFAAQQQRAQALAGASANQPMAPIMQIIVPDGATQEMQNFMVAQAQLANASIGKDTITFLQQNAAAIKAQQQLAQTLAAQSAAQPLPMPPPLVIPPGSTPQMQAFLTLRDQIARDRITLMNQYISATAPARDAAMQQWQQQNASRFQQLQQLAQNLSSSTSN